MLKTSLCNIQDVVPRLTRNSVTSPHIWEASSAQSRSLRSRRSSGHSLPGHGPSNYLQEPLQDHRQHKTGSLSHWAVQPGEVVIITDLIKGLDDKAPPAQAVLVDRTLYISGQLGLTSSGQMAEGGVLAEVEQALENIGNILMAAGGSERKIHLV